MWGHTLKCHGQNFWNQPLRHPNYHNSGSKASLLFQTAFEIQWDVNVWHVIQKCWHRKKNTHTQLRDSVLVKISKSDVPGSTHGSRLGAQTPLRICLHSQRAPIRNVLFRNLDSHYDTTTSHTHTLTRSHSHTVKNICRLSINSTCTRQSDIRRILYFFTNCNKEQREWFRVRLRDPTHELILTPVSVFYDGSSLLKRTTNSTPPDNSLWLNKVRL